MKYSVLLVQRGITAPTHAVCGKSGRTYGNATQSAAHQGVVFPLSIEDYSANAHDICGNIMPSQQWTPEFIADATPSGPTSYGYCAVPSGCREDNGKPALAEYSWSNHFFCATHAPNNAKPLFEGVRPIGTRGNSVPLVTTPDVRPKLNERGVSGGVVENDGNLPREVFAPPAVGADQPERPAGLPSVEAPIPAPVGEFGDRRVEPANPAFADPASGRVAPPIVPQGIPPEPTRGNPVVVAPAPPVAPVAAPANVPAPESPITVIARLMEGLETRLTNKIETTVAARVSEMIQPPAPVELPPMAAPASKAAKKATKPTPVPNAFNVLQKEAKALGINTFGMKREAIEAAVAEKKGS